MKKQSFDNYFAARPDWLPHVPTHSAPGWFFHINGKPRLDAHWSTRTGLRSGAFISLVDKDILQDPSPVPFPLVPDTFAELEHATRAAEGYVRRRMKERARK